MRYRKCRAKLHWCLLLSLGLAYLYLVLMFCFLFFLLLCFCMSLIVSGYQILHKRRNSIKSHERFGVAACITLQGRTVPGAAGDSGVKETQSLNSHVYGLAFPWCCGSGGLRRVWKIQKRMWNTFQILSSDTTSKEQGPVGGLNFPRLNLAVPSYMIKLWESAFRCLKNNPAKRPLSHF